MAPEYGATMGFFPVDGETLRYLTGPAVMPTRWIWWSVLPRSRACCTMSPVPADYTET